MGRVLKDLALAMLNATLILVALCLFLFWKLSATTERIVENFTDSLGVVAPLQQEVAATREELQALRANVAELAVSATGLDHAMLMRVDQRLGDLNQRVDGVQDKLTSIREMPDQLLDQSIENWTGRIVGVARDWRACQAQQDAPES